ncbi:hypothetical protein [Desulforhopalus sp. 52FAK]
MNPLLIEVIIKEKKLEAEKNANHCRLVNLYNRANPGLIARTSLLLGKFLVRIGTRLENSAKSNLAIKEGLYHDHLQS